MKWVEEVNDKLKNMRDASTQEKQWKKRSIYRVPACVTDLNRRAYMPQAVSFGPYHHGKEHLKQMEEHKHRALLQFLKRCQKPIGLFIKALEEVVQDLKDSYEPLDPVWKDDTPRFLQLMILDGCFMLEIMRTATTRLADYSPADPIFSYHGKLHLVPFIRRDMLMLENQLPKLVLDLLVRVAAEDGTKVQDKEYVNKLIVKFCSPNLSLSEMGDCLHVLDVHRKSLLMQNPSAKMNPRESHETSSGDKIIRCATELYEAGIRIEKSGSGNLDDIRFTRGVLRLPPIIVDDTTESIFLNLIAFERFHVGAGNQITSYIFFMDNIIDNDKDVALLRSSDILLNALGSDKAVAKLFHAMSEDITLDPESSLIAVHESVSYYCREPWNQWRANLVHTYFRNPWAILSLIAAIFLFALTTVQTIYSVCSYYKPSS